MKQIGDAGGNSDRRRFWLPLLLTAILGPSVAQASPPWQHAQLTCDYQNLSLNDETNYQMSDFATGTVAPAACVTGHWRLEPDSYIDSVLAITDTPGMSYQEINAVAEIIVRDSGIAQSCAAILMRGNVNLRGTEADITLTMSGLTMSLVRQPTDLADIVGAAPYSSNVIIDGMQAVSEVVVGGNTFRKDIAPGFAAFPLASDVTCAGNRMSITSFPEGIDRSITHSYVRIR